MRSSGSARLLVDSPDGPRTATGDIIDLSEGGCALRLQRTVEADLRGRVLVEIAGTSIWLPVITRWVQTDHFACIVGCEFDRPTPDKVATIRSLLLEQRQLTA